MPGQTSGPSETQGILIGAITLIGAVVLAYLYWQGHLTFSLQPATADRQSDRLQKIADLDDAYEAGEIDEKTYQKQRRKLKAQLMALLEKEN
jgi:uncharacterized membrane protein